jgi:hypothetical protein
VLRHDWLIQRELLLQLLHGTAASQEDLEDPDPRGMRQRAEELRLEHLQLPRRDRIAVALPFLRHH